MTIGSVPDRALVVGLGITGEAVARQLTRRGSDVTVVDDHPSDAGRAQAAALGLELQPTPSGAALDALLDAVDVVLPTPGAEFMHPTIQRALVREIPVWSEFELAARWDDRPMIAITGTNGKTTVTTMVTEMLIAGGTRAVAAGNNDLPLVDALDLDVDVFVVETSSFRLLFTDRFRPIVGTWLNLSEDHLDWHPTMAHYSDAKARMWWTQQPSDAAIANADDGLVMGYARRAPGRLVTFGLHEADYAWRDGVLVGPGGVLAVADRLPRNLPHDLSNAAAALATAVEAGGSADVSRAFLESFQGLPHRVALVRDSGGVRWYDDSKATTPASVVAAASGFTSIVLIAGGRNKGLDLGVLGQLAGRVHSVVAIGEAAEEVAAAFGHAQVVVVLADSMADAVEQAARLAKSGDAVLLSPGCASFDWYKNYAERGDDFARLVTQVAS